MKSNAQIAQQTQRTFAEIARLLQIPKPPYDYNKLPKCVITYLGLNDQQLTLLCMIDLDAAYTCVEPKAETDNQKIAILERIMQIIANSEIKSLQPGGGQIRIDQTDTPISNFIKESIQQTLYGPNEKWFFFEVVTTPESNEIVAKFGGAKESLHDNIKDMLKSYPEHYFRFSGNLKASDIIYKDIDSSWIEKLIVTGTFYCNRNSKTFPAKVDTLDCHGLGKDYITRDAKLPKARVINCECSITDLDVFMRPDEKDSTKLVRTLPAEVETLIVEPSLIVKANFEVNGHLSPREQQKRQRHFENIRKFKEVYGTTITVQDNKGNTLETNLYESIFSTVKTTDNTATTTQTLKERRKGKQLDHFDLYKISMSTEQYNNYADYLLLDYIDQALSYIGYQGKVKAICSDGKEGYCIDFTEDNIKRFLKNLDEVIEQRTKQHTKETSQAKNQVVKPQPKPNEKPKVTYEKKDIKKYMTTRQFNEIAKSIKKDVALELLNAVNQINIDPLEARLGKSVPMFDNKNKITATPTIEKFGGCCLRQKDKSKSIIWQMALDQKTGNTILVCVGFSTTSTEMQNLTDQAWKPKTYTDKELEQNGYVEVRTILEEQKASDLYNSLSQQNPTRNIQMTTPVR